MGTFVHYLVKHLYIPYVLTRIVCILLLLERANTCTYITHTSCLYLVYRAPVTSCTIQVYTVCSLAKVVLLNTRCTAQETV